MDLNQQFGNSFFSECLSYREAGYSDIHLTSNGESFLRSKVGLTPINSPSEAAINHLAEVILGEDQANDIVNGGSVKVIWNNMRCSAVKVDKIAPLHFALRF